MNRQATHQRNIHSEFQPPEHQEPKMTIQVQNAAVQTANARPVDMKLEVVVIPVSDIDRAKKFYSKLGWRLDAEFASGDDFRILQFTPPGSGASVIFGKNVTPAAPGSAQGLYLVVSDIEAARKELLGRGIAVSDVFHHEGDVHTGPDEPYLFGQRRTQGPDPQRRTYQSYVSFKDPDGNGWLLQEVTARLPGRVDPNQTTFASVADLAAAFRRAEAAHGEYEKRALAGVRDANWADWYAEYIVAEQAGKELPQ
jgi:catechol 2,3-dioxygenase-like lactoylglutathione lyase family enzyme